MEDKHQTWHDCKSIKGQCCPRVSDIHPQWFDLANPNTGAPGNRPDPGLIFSERLVGIGRNPEIDVRRLTF